MKSPAVGIGAKSISRDYEATLEVERMKGKRCV
jgi:hypothetical protein